MELCQPYSWAGIIWIEDMGLCKKGEGPGLLWDGVTDMTGEIPFSPSGGVVQLDGGDNVIWHYIDYEDEAKVKNGARVEAVFEGKRTGCMKDIRHFRIIG